jgi:hypothetical protein
LRGNAEQEDAKTEIRQTEIRRHETEVRRHDTYSPENPLTKPVDRQDDHHENPLTDRTITTSYYGGAYSGTGLFGPIRGRTNPHPSEPGGLDVSA